MSRISTENLLSQSKYLYLQSAGSDGSDGSASGIHLRWDLLGTLGDSHLPKGNLAAPGSAYYTTAKYNQPNDFVKIYRAPYDRTYPIIVDLTTAPSEITDDSDNNKIWVYKNIQPQNLTGVTRNVILRFYDRSRYYQVNALYNPQTNPEDFLKNYDGIMGVQVEGQFMFASNIYMTVTDESKSNLAMVETVSPVENTTANTEMFVSARKKFSVSPGYLSKEDADLFLKEDTDYYELEQTGSGNRKIFAENIQYVRFLGKNCYPTYLYLETYNDFLLGKNNESDWSFVKNLSLSIDDDEVFDRLENDNYKIDGRWPRFSNGNTVNVENYKQRWWDSAGTTIATSEGLQSAVKKYLTLSMDENNQEAISPASAATDNPSGEESEEEANTLTDNYEYPFSYLLGLKMVESDFHVARMLGFGLIDTGFDYSIKYIHMAVYDTTSAIDNLASATNRHTYLTLPTGITDNRLPYAAKLGDLSYGLYVSYGDNEKKLISDSEGYLKYSDTRAINLDLANADRPYLLGYFFEPDEEYNAADYSYPLMYGIKYRKKTDPESSWGELLVDSEFKDHSGNPEVAPVFECDENPLYTHMETETGIHQYALYSINCFSRASEIGNYKETTDTEFQTIVTMTPPQNLAVQLIQKENPLMFTTKDEQDTLGRMTGDTTLLRATFDWNNSNYANYWYGNQAQFYFRTTAVNVVQGLVKSITQTTNSSGNTIYKVHTTSYTKTTTSGIETVTPTFGTTDADSYVGSLFASGENQYLVESIETSNISNEGPVFNVQAIVKQSATDIAGDGVLTLSDSIYGPSAGEYFSVSENITNAKSWSNKLAKTVTLMKLSDHTELETYSDGQTSIKHVGGLYGTATIEAYTQTVTVQINGVSTTKEIQTGGFKITYNDKQLPNPTDSGVEYYKGTVRIPQASDPSVIKTLNVVGIDNSGNYPVIKAVDQDFALDENYDLASTYLPIQTGTSVNVNFHPGYRVYFTVDADNSFDQSHIMPDSGEGTRYTYLACRAVDTTTGYTSSLSIPAVIAAREILIPIVPGVPKGSTYATKPNFFGKATYTFDTTFSRNSRDPYMIIFYRGTDQSILNTLYKPETAISIRATLDALPSDEWETSRWNDLVTLTTGTDGKFKEYSGFALPNPDNSSYMIPDSSGKNTIYPFATSPNPGSTDIVNGTDKIFGTQKTVAEVIRYAIAASFIPLTEQPILYRYLKTGYKTSSQKPVTRDSDGNQLIPTADGSNGYNQAPMAVKYTDSQSKIVRFTDYTIDGATSKALYFYCSVEMVNTLAISDPSPIAGPIKLTNTNPPKAPEVKKFYTQVEDETAGLSTGVIFEINDYLAADKVSKIQIYRAFTAANAQDIRTMTAVEPAIEIGNPIEDTFADMDYVPYGDTIYYRLVAIRETTYAIETGGEEPDNQNEEITSYPSSLMLANVIDATNPSSPTLEYSKSDNSTATLYTGVKLTWSSTVHNGTYYIYQRNSSGTWTLLDSLKSNDSALEYQLTSDLTKMNDDATETYYYTFKVTAINSSGLISLDENILTI